MTSDGLDTGRKKTGRFFLHRCKECGAMFEEGGDMMRHVATHEPLINWPWYDDSTPLTEKYEMIEVTEWEMLKE